MSNLRKWFMADDLSGALEIGGAWREAGAPVRIGSGRDISGDDGMLQHVFGVSTETRNVSAAAAGEAVRATLRAAGGKPPLFKKIDSTMRGPVGAEIEAVAAAFPDARFVLCPANPAAGRTVVDGMVLVDGVPLHETAFVRDPVAPVRQARVAGLVAETSDVAAREVRLGQVHSGEVELEAALRDVWADALVAIIDAQTEADLDRIVAAARAEAPRVVFVGAGGLGRAVAKAEWAGAPAGHHTEFPCRGPVLFVVGSAHPVSREQCAVAARGLGLSVTRIREKVGFGAGGIVKHLCARLLDDRAAILTTPDERQGATACSLAVELGGIAGRVIARGAPGSVFITGGEVAREVMAGAGWTGLDLLGEFRPGVAVARALEARGRETLVFVKPGGFGTPRLLVEICEAMLGED